MAIELVTSPVIEPVDMETEIADHLRLNGSEDFDHAANLVKAARTELERVMNISFLTQTWRLWLDDWPFSGSIISLPFTPLQSVTHIKYYDTSGSPTTWTSTNYIVDTVSKPPRISQAYNVTWPSETLRPINGIEIEFVSGYTDPDNIPQPWKQALLMTVSHWYENREAVLTGSIAREIPFGVESLIWSNRIFT